MAFRDLSGSSLDRVSRTHKPGRPALSGGLLRRRPKLGYWPSLDVERPPSKEPRITNPRKPMEPGIDVMVFVAAPG